MGRESGEENKRKGLSLVFVFVFLLFLGIFDYPFVSRLYNERVQGQVAVGYGNSIDTLEDETLEAEWERAQAYNRELAGSSVVLADSFQAVREGQGEYQSLLNPDGDGLMAVLEIPKIDLRLPVYHGTTEKVLQMGAGHLEGTSLPVGGESTHTCISAHRGLPDKTMFTSLDQLEEETASLSGC